MGLWLVIRLALLIAVLLAVGGTDVATPRAAADTAGPINRPVSIVNESALGLGDIQRQLGAPLLVTRTSPANGSVGIVPASGGGAPPNSGSVGTVLLGGFASWYETPGYTAAAGPNLRAAVGPHWRGTMVEVGGGGRSVVVKLTDWCGCGDRHGTPTLLDLSRTAFDVLGDPSAGLLRVSIEVPNRPATGSFALPATDTEERRPR